MSSIVSGKEWKKVVNAKKDLDDMIDTMDVKLNQVVKRTEYEYLNGYNKFIQNKEKDLQSLVTKFNQKNQVSNEKETRIMELE